MKLAITTLESGSNPPMDSHFGRARHFLVVDMETGVRSGIENVSGINATQGAGTQAVQTLAEQGVQAVVTGAVGPKAMRALNAAGIQVYSVTGGTADQAVQAFREGKLQALS